MKKFLLLLIICLLAISTSGCVSQNSCNVDSAYNLASKISEEDPNKFEKLRKTNLIIYHDKSLKVVYDGLLGSWPTEGKGRSIETYNNGDLSVREIDGNELAKLALGEIKFSEAKYIGFGYMNNEEEGEKIILINNGSGVSYVRADDKWEKLCYDVSKIETGMEIELIPILSSEKVDEKEVKKFLDLVDKIRKRFSSE